MLRCHALHAQWLAVQQRREEEGRGNAVEHLEAALQVRGCGSCNLCEHVCACCKLPAVNVDVDACILATCRCACSRLVGLHVC